MKKDRLSHQQADKTKILQTNHYHAFSHHHLSNFWHTYTLFHLYQLILMPITSLNFFDEEYPIKITDSDIPNLFKTYKKNLK